ncbi:MAG: hypothetical protein WAL92_16960 [Thiogranum sp.]
MIHTRLAVLVLLAFQGAASYADEAVVSVQYLEGTWSLDGKAGCGSNDAQIVVFHNNGTLEVARGGEVNRLGFWRVVKNTIVANTLTKPAERENYHPFFGDSYRYEYVTPTIVKAEKDAVTLTIGSDLEKEKREVTLTRCP